jgi:short-subunit dehydrogenase
MKKKYELERAKNELMRDGIFVETIVCDLAQKNSIESMIQEVRRRMNSVDVIVNNAGAIQVGPIETILSQAHI